MPEATHPLLRGVQTVNTSATTAQLIIDLSRAVNYTVRLNPKGGFTIDLTLPKGAGGRIAGKLIVIDPGHGGDDHGAPGVNGAKEKNVALAIARRLAAELRDRGANVILTRDTDAFVTLGERSEIANRAGADLFYRRSRRFRRSVCRRLQHLLSPKRSFRGALSLTVLPTALPQWAGFVRGGRASDGNEYTNGFSGASAHEGTFDSV